MADKNSDTPTAAPRSIKQRSPNHPAFSLEKSIAKARLMYEKAKTVPVHVPIACDYMGVKATSSTGMRWQATLQEFGLLEGEGRGKDKTLKVTERCRVLLNHPDKDSDEYKAALREAAFAPKVHQRVWALRADGHLPPNQQLQFELVRPEFGFTDAAAEAFVAEFRETIAFAGLTEEGDGKDTGEDPEHDPDPAPNHKGQDDREKGREKDDGGQARWKATPVNDEANTAKDIPLPLQSGGTAVLHLPYRLDEKDYEWVTGLLQGLKQSILAPKHETPERPDEEDPA